MVFYLGKVGKEFFFIKGYFYVKFDRVEIYYGIKGKGGMFF